MNCPKGDSNLDLLRREANAMASPHGAVGADQLNLILSVRLSELAS